jgi:hypothetical protein
VDNRGRPRLHGTKLSATIASLPRFYGGAPQRSTGFHHECEMAADLHIATHGSAPLVGLDLQGAHSYRSFFRLSSETITTASSFKGSLGSSWATVKMFAGHTETHSPQPLHASVSMVMKKSPAPSLYP